MHATAEYNEFGSGSKQKSTIKSSQIRGKNAPFDMRSFESQPHKYMFKNSKTTMLTFCIHPYNKELKARFSFSTSNNATKLTKRHLL